MILLYTDGGVSGNGKENSIGAWAYLLKYKDHKKACVGVEKGVTNNQMELQAVIEGLGAIKNKSIPVTVVSDSLYVVNTVNLGWAIRANRELWAEFFQLRDHFSTLILKHVKGHSGHPFNEEVDSMCTLAIKEYKNANTQERKR